MEQPLYHPDSVTWRVNQEPALLLGGGRALLMQLAKPGVAAGVAEHSDFRRRPLHRLAQTLELTLSLTFGTRSQALAAARQINLVHRRVRGEGYSASDPDLLLWVHATLIDSALETHRVFVGELDRTQQARYYQEAKLMGGLLGLRSCDYPASFGDFQAYLQHTVECGLVVDWRARELAGAVLRPPLPVLPGSVYRPLEAVTAGLLPSPLRTAYGLRWTRADRLVFAALRRAVPSTVALVPARLRRMPPAGRGRAVGS